MLRIFNERSSLRIALIAHAVPIYVEWLRELLDNFLPIMPMQQAIIY